MRYAGRARVGYTGRARVGLLRAAAQSPPGERCVALILGGAVGDRTVTRMLEPRLVLPAEIVECAGTTEIHDPGDGDSKDCDADRDGFEYEH
jgi:hypothetical protein